MHMPCNDAVINHCVVELESSFVNNNELIMDTCTDNTAGMFVVKKWNQSDYRIFEPHAVIIS